MRGGLYLGKEKVTTILKTYFASPERSTKEEIRISSNSVNSFANTIQIMNSIPNIVLVLDHNRQIVFANYAMLNYLNLDSSEDILGLRAGESINCLHSDDMEAGCGTSKNCIVCGAMRAILIGQAGDTANEECRILTKSNEARDFMVHCVPMDFNDERFAIFHLTDISDLKRKSALERTFFHDILNTTGGIHGIGELLKNATPEESAEFGTIVIQLAKRLIDEIQVQKDLISAEHNELILQRNNINTTEEILSIIQLYKIHSISKDKTICLSPDTLDFTFKTDERLLSRILGNLVKNALEATEKKGIVTVRGRKIFNYYIFSVHNNQYIDPEVQLQIFQRSFSTKGEGRGLGTYSVKLLTEKYLNGRAGFNSDKINGTIFYTILPIL